MQHHTFKNENLDSWRTDAEQGRVEALYNLGLLYSTGQDVPIDLVEAHKWFNLAAVKGNVEARECRTVLALEMSAEQIAEAQRQAREWLHRH